MGEDRRHETKMCSATISGKVKLDMKKAMPTYLETQGRPWVVFEGVVEVLREVEVKFSMNPQRNCEELGEETEDAVESADERNITSSQDHRFSTIVQDPKSVSLMRQ